MNKWDIVVVVEVEVVVDVVVSVVAHGSFQKGSRSKTTHELESFHGSFFCVILSGMTQHYSSSRCSSSRLGK